MTAEKTLKRLKQPTMYDVAKLAGVSQPTVSRVLNHNKTAVQISAATRQRVLDAVAELGYHPNVIARSLRTQRTGMISLLVADITNSFYHVIARAVQDVARQRDYEVLISNSDHIYSREMHFAEVLSKRVVDGAILVPIHLTDQDLDGFLSLANAPIVVLGQHIQHPNIDVVYGDDEAAMYEAARWMVNERGYREFGFVGVPEDLPPGPRRWRGFKRALDELGLGIDPRFMVMGDFTIPGGEEAARALIRASKRLPRALFVLNDLMAIGVILTLQDAGYRIPDDVAVIGFDNIPESTIVRPTLTTIAQDSHDLGVRLAEVLFERIDNPNITGRRLFRTACQIIPRQSA